MNPTSEVEPTFLTADQICQKYSLTKHCLRRWTTSFNSPAFVSISPRIVRHDAKEFDA
jgi:hypothetical protein